MLSNKFMLLRQPCISQQLSGNDKFFLAVKNQHRVVRIKMHPEAVRTRKRGFSVLQYTFFPLQLTGSSKWKDPNCYIQLSHILAIIAEESICFSEFKEKCPF